MEPVEEATSTSKKELSELVDAVDRLINEISNNFSSKTRDIVDKLNAMGERIDALEARAADSYEEEIQEKKSQASLNAPK